MLQNKVKLFFVLIIISFSLLVSVCIYYGLFWIHTTAVIYPRNRNIDQTCSSAWSNDYLKEFDIAISKVKSTIVAAECHNSIFENCVQNANEYLFRTFYNFHPDNLFEGQYRNKYHQVITNEVYQCIHYVDAKSDVKMLEIRNYPFSDVRIWSDPVFKLRNLFKHNVLDTYERDVAIMYNPKNADEYFILNIDKICAILFILTMPIFLVSLISYMSLAE